MGPLTDISYTGSFAENIRNALEIAEEVRSTGAIPYVPHLGVFWDMVFPHEYDWWIDMDLDWLGACDVAFRLPGKCPGCDIEYERAALLGIEVFTNIELLKKWIRDHDYQIGLP